MAAPGRLECSPATSTCAIPTCPARNIDHIVAAEVEHGALEVWPEERRLHNGAVLSDHAPVEMRIG